MKFPAVKKIFTILTLAAFTVNAQVEVQLQKKAPAKKAVKTPSNFGYVESLEEIKQKARPLIRKYREVPNKLRRHKYVNQDALPKKEDKARQEGKGKSLSLTPLKSWQGMDESSQGVSPPDPSGAVSANHYVQMVNTAMQIFDKNGNSLWGPTTLSSVFPGSSDDGDPIVLYDKYADKWFISQFQDSPNQILIAISQTNDPLGSWYYYEYDFDDFPDYPKYSIWGDGYYMTANMTAQNAVCFERDKMLQGDPSARMVALTFPDLEDNGFFSALPANAFGETLPQTPMNMFYFQDDGWGAASDVIKIWEMDVDWDTPENSTISVKQEISVTPFNTEFDDNWDDITQPNICSKLDAVPGAFMFMANYRQFSDYNAITLCHTVDVDLSPTVINSAIRWYELRETNGSWSLYQESTYAPDNENRWMASMSMDRKGNIGMAYSISSSSTYPSIKFTGRRKDDALNEMTISESNAFNGSGSLTSTNRFGDYAHLTLDPTDELTFWYTGEFASASGWETGIFSFKVGEEEDFDAAVIDVINPESGVLTASEQITVVVKNLGKNTISNFPISFNLDGNVVNETFSGSILVGESSNFTFNALGDFGTPGNHDLSVYTSLSNDGDLFNDTISVEVQTAFAIDAGVTQFISPTSSIGLTNEDVTVRVKNFGSQTLTEVPLALEIDGGLVLLDTLKESLLAGESIVFTFAQKVDLSTVKTYQLIAYSSLIGDQKSSNDTTKTSVTNSNCNPLGYCDDGDSFTSVTFSDLSNTSGCSSNGYSDFSSQVATVERNKTYSLSVSIDYDENKLSVWIDYNDNQVFEDEERVLTNEVLDYTGNYNINIPADAEVGKHLMRLRTSWDSPSSDPCVELEYGETEDYTVDVVDENNIEEVNAFEFEVIPVGNGVQILANELYQKDLNVRLFNGIGQSLYQFNNLAGVKLDKVISLANFAPGIYYVDVNDGEENVVKQFVVR